MKELIIIGAGPAGLTAAIYGIRAGLDVLLIERYSPGGQVINTYEVENYPGFVEPVQGWELMSAMEGQVRRLGVEIINGDVKSIIKNTEENLFNVELTDNHIHKAKAIILACGATHNQLKIPGETELTGKGVSYCATCDGAFFKDKVTAVNGGGDTALEEALFLTKFASKVYLIHRREEFRGAKILQDRVLSNDKIEPIYNSVVKSINGSENVTSLTLKNVKTSEEKELKLDGLFIFIGYSPNTGFLPEEILNERSEVIVNKEMQTSVPGLFAAGDMREDSKRQIVMAAADGATAALEAYNYVNEMK
ncbi:MAG: thioredoxin-disulfide reductase [Spirochaetes bacterium]|nr:thioredoxin-disulfide reductase [Spirochaetota bacterium]